MDPLASRLAIWCTNYHIINQSDNINSINPPPNSNLYFYASMNGVLEAVEKDMQAIEAGLLSTKDWCVTGPSLPFNKLLCFYVCTAFIKQTHLPSTTPSHTGPTPPGGRRRRSWSW